MSDYDFAADMSDDEQLAALAALTVIEKRVKDAVTRIKTRQRDRIGAGHGAKAFLDHDLAATISVTKDGDGKFVVKDPDAFSKVLLALGDDPENPESRVQLAVLPKKSSMTPDALAEFVDSHGGEVPAGVEWKDGVKSTVKIALEKQVKDKPLNLSNLIGIPQLLGIEAQAATETTADEAESEDPWAAK
jgi:hypothetical protein